MSKSIRISVVVPLYNKSETILRSLNSILRQSFSDWECIVVDDGSTDQGPKKVLSLSDPRIQLHSQPNAGPGAARNSGVKLARAHLVAFLDADDEWDHDYLEYHFKMLGENTSAAASVCGHRRVGAKTDAEKMFSKHGITTELWRLPLASTPESVKIATDFMHSGCIVIRKDVFWKYGGYYDRDRCTYGEDTHLWIQVIASETLWRTPKAMMCYHVDDSCLGLGRKTLAPPWPMLFHPERLLSACRPDIRPTLNQAFGFYAILAANRLLTEGKYIEARSILRKNQIYSELSSSRSVSERKKVMKLMLLQPYIVMKGMFRKISSRHGTAGQKPAARVSSRP